MSEQADSLYQHFAPEEHWFIDRVLDWLQAVEENYSVVTTYFLNPREVEILVGLANKRALQIFSSQTLAVTEQSKLILAPDFYELDENDFDLALLAIDYPHKFAQLTHSQILGSFLGQTGIQRRELGDIIVNEQSAQIFVSQHLVTFFQENIKKIGRISVKFDEIPLSNLTEIQNQAVTKILPVSSLRIDKIIPVSFNISRNIAANMLQSNKVKLNYHEIEKKDFSVKEGDLISVRGYGRIRISKILGLTKKGKQRVELEITSNHLKM